MPAGFDKALSMAAEVSTSLSFIIIPYVNQRARPTSTYSSRTCTHENQESMNLPPSSFLFVEGKTSR